MSAQKNAARCIGGQDKDVFSLEARNARRINAEHLTDNSSTWKLSVHAERWKLSLNLSPSGVGDLFDAVVGAPAV